MTKIMTRTLPVRDLTENEAPEIWGCGHPPGIVHLIFPPDAGIAEADDGNCSDTYNASNTSPSTGSCISAIVEDWGG